MKAAQSLRCWAVLDRDGKMVRWAGGFATREAAWAYGAKGLMGACEYERLGPEGRKQLLKKNGVRVVRAVLTLEANPHSLRDEREE